MRGLTNYITDWAWPEIFLVWYVWVDEVFHRLYHGHPLRQRVETPVFSDSEVMASSLIADTFFQEHEELMITFVRQYYQDLFPRLLSRSRFNRRRSRTFAGRKAAC